LRLSPARSEADHTGADPLRTTPQGVSPAYSLYVTRRAKIVCTIGPATATPDRIRALVESGMDVARLNFSHGHRADHERAYQLVREASDAAGRSVAVLADLQGPKIRLGTFADGPVVWRTGERVTITTADVPGSHDRVSTTYPLLAEDVRPGDRLLVDDGNVALVVLEVDGGDVRCDVLEGGPVSDCKGLSLPGVAVSVPALSDKDAEDLRFALGLRVDLVALSFVRSPEDVQLVHKVMDGEGCRVPVIAKLEKPEAIANLDRIVAAFDGAMVARGDLGVELPLERVPLVQKQAIQVCRENAKPVIVATQMLESMIEHSRPTRAEASDVANAVLDGADALMLSGETSVGRYPVQAVSTMARIIDCVESASTAVPELRKLPDTKPSALVKAAKEIGEVLGAAALVAFTQTGDTVRRLARHHSALPLLAFTPEPSVRARLALTWGVETFLVPTVRHTDEMVRQVDQSMLEHDRGKAGDLVVIVAGSPPHTPGSTNLIRVHRLGDHDDRG
jgi:pyruvate kinase